MRGALSLAVFVSSLLCCAAIFGVRWNAWRLQQLQDLRQLERSRGAPLPTIPADMAAHAPANNALAAPRNQQEPAPVANALKEPVAIDIQVEVPADRRPMVRGKTNLPEGMRLSVVVRGLTAGGSGAAWIDASGSFEEGPFGGAVGLPAGNYVAEISASSFHQSESVLAVIGRNGERLRGPQIKINYGIPCIDIQLEFTVGTEEEAALERGRRTAELANFKWALEQYGQLHQRLQQARSEALPENPTEWNRFRCVFIAQVDTVQSRTQGRPYGSGLSLSRAGAQLKAAAYWAGRSRPEDYSSCEKTFEESILAAKGGLWTEPQR